MSIITKDRIVGTKIVDLHETYVLTEHGLDERIIYFTVDRGFTFLTPSAGDPWETVDIPPNARRLEDDVRWIDIVRRIKLHAIAGVFCGPYNAHLGFHYPWDGTIVFDDGSTASNTMVAPHGTGSAGLYFLDAADSASQKQGASYFDIPLKQNTTDQGT
jgi:hypothetical protein